MSSQQHSKSLSDFCEQMAARLSKNCCFDNEYDKSGNVLELVPGWLKDTCTFDHLLSKMAEHCGQINDLMRLITNGSGKEKIVLCEKDIAELTEQCADCANFAMMISDRATKRKKTYREDIGDFVVE